MQSLPYLQMASTKLLEMMYESFTKDPGSVDASWRYFFEGLEFADMGKGSDIRTLYLIDAYRRFGHKKAFLNPLLSSPPKTPPELALEGFGLREGDLHGIFPTFGILPEKRASLGAIIARLESIYCGTLGFEYMNTEEKVCKFIQMQIESAPLPISIEEKKEIFTQLNRAELFETFLHRRYVGQKRFSLEGGETLISLLHELVRFGGGKLGLEEIVMGMAHRGRLNVLANLLGKSYADIFREFEDVYDPTGSLSDGDVKYHKGYSADVAAGEGKKLHITLTANPSHLESVDPVVLGRTYAKQKQRNDSEKTRVLALLIHGDASLPGQGVVYESIQLSKLEGYRTGGTLHICVDNQIGFTTLAREYRSMQHSTDVALAFGFPVFHVNAEDPERALDALRLALQVRQAFHIDVFINLFCYRKYGHNEADEPSFTQPKEYEVIRKKLSIREIYRDKLISHGSLEKKMAEDLEKAFQEELHSHVQEMEQRRTKTQESAFTSQWKPYQPVQEERLFTPISTGVSQTQILALMAKCFEVPQDFTLHPKLFAYVQERAKKKDLDWALAEQLAFASLLIEGTSVRLSGQDSKRGTFTQRHAVWVDQKTAKSYSPLAHLKEGQGTFSIYNSPLSEFGVLGFEFGYSLDAPDTLVLWEAQFGDFANVAQVIIDQFIAVSEQKWRRFSGLVLLLPHGYEGGGAEHSSARLERFLQLAAQNNMQIVYPTTPSQYFHLLRRQMKQTFRLPLVVMTPKGLLRHPACMSAIEELEKGHFQEILEEGTGEESRLLLCSGRVYYDLLAYPEKDRAIIRIEQLYPLDTKKLSALLQKYAKVKEIVWVQEEPQNMGGWSYLFPILSDLTEKKVRYAGRERSAATASGSHSIHEKEQENLIKKAFTS